jgi:hypothetical protein
MADVREDGVERLRHEGRVHRWQRRGSAWPGHTAFVAIRAGEVIVGDRYAGEGIERTYACHPQALLEGCFQALIGEQLGADVLAEVVVEVRRALGPLALPASPAAKEPAKPQVASTPAITKTAHQDLQDGSAASVTAPTAAAVATPAEHAGSKAPAAAARTQQKVVSEHSAAGPVDVAVVAFRALDLPLAVALRAITRTPVQELLGALGRLPCTVLTSVSQAEAEGVQQRLAELGAEVRLVPARAS